MKPCRSWLAKGVAGIALASLVAGCGQAAEASARDVPDSPVVDRADILPAAMEAALDKRLTDYWKDTGNALVVVSVSSLDGKTVEKYAFDLFKEWGIGDAKTDRGLLLLVAPNERKVRIEVGCGLESVITNDEAAEVIREDITPRYRQGDLAGGTLAGVDRLIDELAVAPTEGRPLSPICKADLEKTA